MEALPLDLPHDIKIDISELDHAGQAIFLKDLEVSEKIEIIDDLDLPVVTTVEFSEEVEEEEVIAEGEEGTEAEGGEGSDNES